MRVICVQSFENTYREEMLPYPEVGDQDEVIEVVEAIHTYYVLARFDDDILYHSSHFATLPDQPAEVIEEKEPEYATT